jgi:beta-N-acetylhexosaminidase
MGLLRVPGLSVPLTAAAVLLSACASGVGTSRPSSQATAAGTRATGCAIDGCPLPPAGFLDAEGRRWVDQTLAGLSLRQRVAQLVIQWMPGNFASPSSEEFAEWAAWVRDNEIGGIYLSIGLPHSYAAKVNELQALAPVPLLVTSDFENGGPGMRINHSYALPSLLPQGGGTSFPPTMAFGAIGDDRFAREYGRITGLEARAVGVNLNFAPVLDVNSNPDNPIINTRSFGEDPALVARLGAAYIEGAHEAGLLATAKHFPGHGDTETDSHVDLPIVPADWERLEAVELVPFRRAVAEGVDAIMTAHVVPSGVGGLDAPPATFDPVFMTELLRERMGFEGLLFTDALTMGALANRFGSAEVPVRALEAGADVLLMPADVGESIDAVVAAVESGRVTEARITASVRRILEAKARAGVHRNRTVDLDLVDDRVGTGAHQAFADSAATLSITLLRDAGHVLPLAPARARTVLSVTYARTANLPAGRAFDPEIARLVPTFRSARIGPESTTARLDSLYIQATNADLVLLNAYVPPRAGVGDVAVPQFLTDFVSNIAARVPTVVTSFGNPYLLAALPEAPTYVIAWGDREVSQRAAARALFGLEAITGKLPISIPPLYDIGDGLERPVSVPTSGVGQMAPPPTAVVAATASAAAEAVPGPDRPAYTRSPIEAAPESAGMSATGLDTIDQLILDAIDHAATPGAVLAVGRHGKLVRLRGYGALDWAAGSASATPGSLYDLASLTKVVGTTSAIMALVDDGALDLDARVVTFLPWWGAGDPRKAEVTVRQLLLHRAGLPPFKRFYTDISGREAYQSAIGALALDYDPGTATVYSDIGFMTLAFIVEDLSGTPIDDFLRERLWAPLGMLDTDFRPDPRRLARVAPTEVDDVFRNTHVRGVVHDENAYAIGQVAGHAGLFSSAWDLAVFAQMMLDRGLVRACQPEIASGNLCSAVRKEDVRVLGEPTVSGFTVRFDDTASRALGWDTPSGMSSAGDYFTERAFGHTGFTGTSIWMDPELDVFVVLLTNRVNPTRENSRHVPLRRAVHDAVANAIVDRSVGRRDEAPHSR